MRDNFREAAENLSLSAPPLFESIDEEDIFYLSLFDDHSEDDGILINPWFIMRMRVKKGELPHADLRFESKIQSNQLFHAWCQKVLGFSRVTKKLNQAGMKKANTCARLTSLTRHHKGLELLVSQ